MLKKVIFAAALTLGLVTSFQAGRGTKAPSIKAGSNAEAACRCWGDQLCCQEHHYACYDC